jgi:Na+-transporting NADH:ubiquinone oxidoreductase subunit B
MWARRDFGYEAGLWDLLTGRIGAVFTHEGRSVALAAGSAGEVSALVLLLVGAYLLVTRTAQWRLTVATMAGAVLTNVVLRSALGLSGVPPLLFTLLSGALLYAAVFMVTDPVSAPKQKPPQWVYGVFIGAMIVFLRYKAIFAGGVGFAILLGNMLAPSLDLWYKRFKAARTGA